MDNLLILGAGQYSSIIYEIAEASGNYGKIDFLDDYNPTAIGKLSESKSFIKSYNSAIVAIGNPEKRLELTEELENIGYTIPVLISDKAFVSKSSVIEKGTVIEPMSVVHSNVYIGKSCLICAGAVINHNAIIEAGCQVDCNSTVCAQETLPKNTKLNSGCSYCSNK